jgi:hypothetical protein
MARGSSIKAVEDTINLGSKVINGNEEKRWNRVLISKVRRDVLRESSRAAFPAFNETNVM